MASVVTANGPRPSWEEPLRLPPCTCATIGPDPADGQVAWMEALADAPKGPLDSLVHHAAALIAQLATAVMA